MSKRKGFTLIELLVVIAIIAILAAILFPVFARAKANARLTTCTNNLKQLSTAMSLYLDTYNDRFPWAGANAEERHDTRMVPLGIGGSKTCYDALRPYIKTDAVRWCPEWNHKYRSIEAAGWSYWYYCPHSIKSGGNWWVKNYNSGKAELCGRSLSEVRFTTKKPIICEVSSSHQRFDGKSHYLYPILYVDGHTRVVVAASDNDPKLVEYLYIGIDGTYNGYYSKL